MATSQEFKNYVLEQLNLLNDITCRPMMGEFLLYYKGCLFGGIYDSRLLIKKTEHNFKFGLAEAIPYNGAKPMLKIEDIENKATNAQIVECTYKDLAISNMAKSSKKRK